MESLSALINRVKERHEAGCSVEELLLLIEQLKIELTGSLSSVEHSANSVAVMMPAGYHPTLLDIPQTATTTQIITLKDEISQTDPGQVIIQQKQSGWGHSFPEKQIPALPKPAYSVLRPPVVAAIEEEVLQPVAFPLTEKGQKEPYVMDEILGFLNIAKPEKMDQHIDFPEKNAEIEEKPIVFELDLKEDFGNDNYLSTGETHPLRQKMEEVDTLERFQDHTKPKELHEILAARVVATAPGKPESKKMLAETLGSTRIADLKKGIAVNDRFRFIKSLFRGDETLFDRSVKTINNFNILAEAQYWIQRELAIKLGWNDEDELVQQFYSLVSRRFL